jgi:hypothetical protein
MTEYSFRGARLARHLLVLTSLALLAGCIDSAAPILTDAEPLLGKRLHLQLYGLHEGAAHEPATVTFGWLGSRYVNVGRGVKDIGDVTLHAFEGPDIIVQNMRAGKPVEYAIARKLADGTYLVVPIDDNDADAATRAKYCGKEAGCRVATPEAVLAFARATAAKPHSTGGLAVVLAEH